MPVTEGGGGGNWCGPTRHSGDVQALGWEADFLLRLLGGAVVKSWFLRDSVFRERVLNFSSKLMFIT